MKVKGLAVWLLPLAAFSLACDQRTNPLNPDAIVTVVNVTEINTRIEMQQSFIQDPFGNVYPLCEVEIDPERVIVTFQEEYGGQWATVYRYEVEYLDANGNPMGLTPLWGTTSVRIPPGGQASVNVGLVTEEVLAELETPGTVVVKARLTLWVRGDYQGEVLSNGLDYQFTFYHDIFITFSTCEENP